MLNIKPIEYCSHTHEFKFACTLTLPGGQPFPLYFLAFCKEILHRSYTIQGMPPNRHRQ